MVYDLDDTIAAIGTATGGAARGMVRLSGPRLLDCLVGCFQPTDSTCALADLRFPSVVAGSITLADVTLPCDLFLWPSERSYTRQPTAELHTLGSPPLLEQLLRTVCDQGVRLAEAGEFTLRAFLAGRLDLTQAEAVLGVIDARSQTDLSAALAQLAGGLSAPLAELREQLLQLLAELEAGLDFAEEDIEFISSEQLHNQLTAAQTIISSVVEQLASRSEATDLPRVVLSGPPNAGKSSLFNALVERYATDNLSVEALVSSQAGTTRDFVTAVFEIEGLPCELVDTAGEDSGRDHNAIGHNSIDGVAQEMTSQQRSQASLVVRCHDATTAEPTVRSVEITAWTKVDLLNAPLLCSDSDVACSSKTGEGIERLAQMIHQLLTDAKGNTHSVLSNTTARCAESLHLAEQSVAEALQLVSIRGGEELIASEVRNALQALGQVVGTVYTDDILDRIFGQFCIGK